MYKYSDTNLKKLTLSAGALLCAICSSLLGSSGNFMVSVGRGSRSQSASAVAMSRSAVFLDARVARSAVP